MGLVSGLKNRRRAKRWQHWTEFEPLEDYGRRAGIVAAIAFALFVAVIVLVIVGLVVAR